MKIEDNRPQVWAARKLMGRGYDGEVQTIAYFVSKARVSAVTKTYSKKTGRSTKQYEIEFETPEELDHISLEGYVATYAECGNIKADKVFLDYRQAGNHVNMLNELLERKMENSVPASQVAKTIATAKKDMLYARELERFFKKIFTNEETIEI